MGPRRRIIGIIVTVLVASPRWKPLKKGVTAHMVDILPIELVCIDMEIMPPQIHVLAELFRDLNHRKLKDLLGLSCFLIETEVEGLACLCVHNHAHVNVEVKAHCRCEEKCVLSMSHDMGSILLYHTPWGFTDFLCSA
jgi:hypothetical protein